MNDIAAFGAVKALLEKSVDFKIRTKRSSPLMWTVYVITLMWIWNRRFMTDYITTIPVINRVYFPDGYIESDPAGAWGVLAHEGRHLLDAKAQPAWFAASYLFPQIVPLLPLAVFVGIAFLPWWGTLLAVGVAIAPWPAPWRARWERHAYQVSIVMDGLRGYDITGDWYPPQRADEYGWGYYRMVWRRSVAEAWVGADIARAKAILAGTLRDDYTAAVIAAVQGAS